MSATAVEAAAPATMKSTTAAVKSAGRATVEATCAAPMESTRVATAISAGIAVVSADPDAAT
ncbi:MAG TPA: hypothetical protein VHY57_00995, partial [Rhizomicrobium sp.]|nr:hypothetical protein [Rhizomicrobium sp.]